MESIIFSTVYPINSSHTHYLESMVVYIKRLSSLFTQSIFHVCVSIFAGDTSSYLNLATVAKNS